MDLTSAGTPLSINLWLPQRCVARRWRIRQRPELGMYPVHLPVVVYGRIEVLGSFVDHNPGASWNCRAQLFLGGLGRIRFKQRVLQAKLLGLHLWQPVDWLQQRNLFQIFRFHVVGALVFGREGRRRHPSWPVAPGIHGVQDFNARISRRSQNPNGGSRAFCNHSHSVRVEIATGAQVIEDHLHVVG